MKLWMCRYYPFLRQARMYYRGDIYEVGYADDKMSVFVKYKVKFNRD